MPATRLAPPHSAVRSEGEQWDRLDGCEYGEYYVSD